MPHVLRQELSNFNSILCFKVAILGMEEVIRHKAYAIALTKAGCSRGKTSRRVGSKSTWK